jgi:hypothetical protein
MLLNSIILIMLGVESKLWSSSLCNFLSVLWFLKQSNNSEIHVTLSHNCRTPGLYSPYVFYAVYRTATNVGIHWLKL